MRTLKIRIDSVYDNNVKLTVFSGVDSNHLQNAGNIVLTRDEYGVYMSALSIGMQTINGNHKRVNLIFENEKEFNL